MTVEELAKILVAEGFRADCYDLTGGGTKELYVLKEDRGLWSVFYAERGHENSKRTFTNVSLACHDLLSRIRSDPTTKKR